MTIPRQEVQGRPGAEKGTNRHLQHPGSRRAPRLLSASRAQAGGSAQGQGHELAEVTERIELGAGHPASSTGPRPGPVALANPLPPSQLQMRLRQDGPRSRGARRAGLKPTTACPVFGHNPPSLFKMCSRTRGLGRLAGCPCCGLCGPISERGPAGRPRPSAPGAGLHTFLPGQGDDVRGTLTHHLGDVHGAVDPACDGDGPEHGLSLELGTRRMHRSREGGVGEGSHRPPPVPRPLPESRPFDFPQG